MIYFKRSLAGSLKRKIKNVFCKTGDYTGFSFILPAFKKIFALCIFLLFLIYFSFLFWLPNFINEDNLETRINSYLLQNFDLLIDAEDIKIKPNYKLDISIKTNGLKIKNKNGFNFAELKNLKTDINIVSILFKKIYVDKIEADEIKLNILFKNSQVNSLKYLNIEKLKRNAKSLKVKGLKISTNKFNIEILDETVNKIFYINSSDFKFDMFSLFDDDHKNIKINAKTIIKTKDNKIGNLNTNLNIKVKEQEILQTLEKNANLSYNPLKYADLYKFYFCSDINLKLNFLNPNKTYEGKIDVKEYKFKVKNIDMPKNNAVFSFKGNKISSECNFNFIKNQFLKVKFFADISKNKKLEASLSSSEINLEELNEILAVFAKLFNFKEFSNLKISGIAKTDIFLKSDFKTLISKGKLFIKDGFVSDKKNNIKLENINSDIDFDNNAIFIKNAVMFLDKAKLNLAGNITSNADLNLRLTSDGFKIDEFLILLKSIPFSSSLLPKLNDFNIKDGKLKIDLKIEGKLSSPKIIINSAIEDLKMYIKSYGIEFISKNIQIISNQEKDFNSDILFELNQVKINRNNLNLNIPKVNAILKDNNILIKKTELLFEKIPVIFEGVIKDYTAKPLFDILISAKVPKDNNFVVLKSASTPDLFAHIAIKDDNLNFEKFELSTNGKTIMSVNGAVGNIFSEKDRIEFKNLKVNFIEKTDCILKKINNLELNIQGTLDIQGKILKPLLYGNLNIGNLSYKPLDLSVNHAILNFEGANFYFNTSNAFLSNQKAQAIAQGKILDNKILITDLNILSDYVNYKGIILNVSEFLKYKNSVEIKSFNANIANFEIFNTVLNDLKLQGSLKDDILKLSDVKLKAFTGNVSGSANVNISTLDADMDLILKEISTRHFLNDFKELKNFSVAVSGKLSALIQTKTNLSNIEFDKFLTRSKIYAKFNVDNGELAQFAKLERLLQAGNIISQSILKLNINSIISAISNKNTGDFKTIEGTLKIDNGITDIQYIKTQGSNMSLYMTGMYNLYNDNVNLDIYGRIPVSIVNVLGNVGKFSMQSVVNRMSNDTKEMINSISSSPIEKNMSTSLDKDKIDKIPPLSYSDAYTQTREFKAVLNGKITETSSVKYFKWNTNSTPE